MKIRKVGLGDINKISKNDVVTIVAWPTVINNLSSCIKSNKLKKAYENGLIYFNQKLTRYDDKDFNVIDKWIDSNYGELFLIHHNEKDFIKGGIAYIVQRAAIASVHYINIPEPTKRVFIKDKNDKETLILVDEDGNSVKVIRNKEDQHDLEKAVLYGVAKLYNIPRSEILEYLRLARLEYNNSITEFVASKKS